MRDLVLETKNGIWLFQPSPSLFPNFPVKREEIAPSVHHTYISLKMQMNSCLARFVYINLERGNLIPLESLWPYAEAQYHHTLENSKGSGVSYWEYVQIIFVVWRLNVGRIQIIRTIIFLMGPIWVIDEMKQCDWT